ncbi:MAG TPA: PD-(D/E)XK nuclease family protein, partial [Candidatus Megaira endosymbiont of Hartmannula sinica]|nr:PD-(D/E)XK nuclease family protein [Candidatus Megaera endosymbiont of Hartmannula sinica]
FMPHMGGYGFTKLYYSLEYNDYNYIDFLSLDSLNSYYKNHNISTQQYHPLYSYHKIISLISSNNSRVKYISARENKLSYFDDIVFDIKNNFISEGQNLLQHNKKTSNKVEYSLFSDISDEADYIAKYIDDFIEDKNLLNNIKLTNVLDIKIAIISTDIYSKNIYKNSLDKYSLSYIDLIGSNLKDHFIIDFISLVIKNICYDFSLERLVSFLLSPIIINDNSKLLYSLLNEQASNINSIDSFKQFFYSISNNLDNDLVSFVEKIIIAGIFSLRIDLSKGYIRFNNLLEKIFILVEDIYPSFNEIIEEANITDFFRDILNPELNNIAPLDYKLYPDFFISLTNNIRYDDGNRIEGQKIIICKSDDISFIDFDLVIMPNMTNEYYPSIPFIIKSPWMNKNIQEKISLEPRSLIGFSWYNFYLNLMSKNVVMTRVVDKQNKNISDCFAILESIEDLFKDSFKIKRNNFTNLRGDFFINELINKKKDNIEYIENIEKLNYRNNTISSNIIVNNKERKVVLFPYRISVSDFYLLINSPYNFYVKKILGLKKIDSIFSISNDFAKFGNLIHGIMDEYSKLLVSNNIKYCRDGLSLIISNLVKKYAANIEERDIYLIKIDAFYEEIVTFFKDQMTDYKYIYTEIKGEVVLNFQDIMNDILITRSIKNNINYKKDVEDIIHLQDLKLNSKKEIVLTAIADRVCIDSSGCASIFDYKTGVIPSKKKVMNLEYPQLVIEAVIAMCVNKNSILLKGLGDNKNIINYKKSRGFYIEKSNEGSFIKESLHIDKIVSLVYIKIASNPPYIRKNKIDLSAEDIVKLTNQIYDILKSYLDGEEFDSSISEIDYDSYREIARRDLW